MTRMDWTCSGVHESRFTDFTWRGGIGLGFGLGFGLVLGLGEESSRWMGLINSISSYHEISSPPSSF